MEFVKNAIYLVLKSLIETVWSTLGVDVVDIKQGTSAVIAKEEISK